MFLGLETGAYATLEKTESNRWRLVDHGQAKDIKLTASGGPPIAPKNAIRFVLEADATGGARLTVANGYDQRLVYKGDIQQRASSAPVKTSLCPVWPNIISIEFWPYALKRINLGEFRLVQDEQQKLACE